MQHRIQFLSMAILTLTAACGAGSAGVDRTSLFLSPAPPPAGRMCYAAGNPPVLPASDALVDSAAVASAVRLRPGESAGYALFSVVVGNQGQVSSFRTIETNLAGDRLASVEQLTSGRLKTQAAGAPWSVRLKVSSDTTPRIQVGRSELCPASLRGPIDIVTEGSVGSTSRRSRSGSSATSPQSSSSSARFTVLVDTAGQVLELRLAQSSGQTNVDQQMESAIRRTGFLPTLVDGKPVTAWTQWPLSGQ